MPRSYSKVKVTIWSDPDFRAMPVNAQWLYFAMLTHPTITSCGVLDWREPKLVKRASGITIPELRQAAWDLGQKRFIAVDPETEEALVRSFVRHDGMLKTPNTAKALVREYGDIASTKLMELVSIETRRAVKEHPEWGGVEFVEPVTKQFPGSNEGPSDLVPEWFANPFDSPSNVLQKSSEFDTPKKGESLQVSFPIPIPNPKPLSKDKRGSDSDESSKPARLASRKRPFPADWKPTEAHSKRARELGIDLSWEATKFQDSALANGRTYLDWDRAFSNWLSRAKEFSGGVNQSRPVNDDPYFYLNKPRGGSDA